MKWWGGRVGEERVGGGWGSIGEVRDEKVELPKPGGGGEEKKGLI